MEEEKRCLFCNLPEPRTRPADGSKFICSRCVQKMLIATDVPKARWKARESGQKRQEEALNIMFGRISDEELAALAPSYCEDYEDEAEFLVDDETQTKKEVVNDIPTTGRCFDRERDTRIFRGFEKRFAGATFERYAFREA